MSDRTRLKCHVYDCPEDQREEARAALEQWGEWGEYEGDPESPVDGLTAVAAITCDTVPDIAAALRKAAQGASWITWEEPAATGPGRVIAFTPALGEHRGRCDVSGQTLIGRSDFDALRVHHSGEALITALDTALGGPWARDYAARVPVQDRPLEPGEAGDLVSLAAYLEEGAGEHDAGGAVDLPGRARLAAGALRKLAGVRGQEASSRVPRLGLVPDMRAGAPQAGRGREVGPELG